MQNFQISESTLIKRINRKLSRDGYRLLRTTDWRYAPFIIIDGDRITYEWQIDLEEKGRELDVLRDYEDLA